MRPLTRKEVIVTFTAATMIFLSGWFAQMGDKEILERSYFSVFEYASMLENENAQLRAKIKKKDCKQK